MKTTTITCDMCGIEMASNSQYYTLVIEEHNIGKWVARINPDMEICDRCYKEVILKIR